jgi:glucose/arabinose dehydrogenase
MRRIAIALLLLFAVGAPAATVEPGFVEEVYVRNLVAPTAMAFAPDGRLFYSEQAGQLRVIEDRRLLETPFVSLDVDPNGERGLLGIAFDPNFTANGFVYVYYTAKTPTIHNRVSRFTAQGNVAVSGSELVLLDLDDLSEATNHNGGALHFGNDGRLYVSTGDNATSANAQTLANRLGKILRINANGSIPADNPFYTVATGVNRAIWAFGLRNPFTFAVQRSTGRIFVNDVGEATWEEINEGSPGANYGWPQTEGPTTEPGITAPLYSYNQSTGGCAITGGEFYEAAPDGFPSRFVGRYFFGDFCLRAISTFDPATGEVSLFATDIRRPVDVREGPDGALYVLTRPDAGPRIIRIRAATSDAPEIVEQPASTTLLVGQSTTFSVEAIGAPTLQYQWRRNGAAIAGATAASYAYTGARLGDTGAVFDVVISNDYGTVTSDAAVLTVTNNTRPAASFTQPLAGTTYAGGDRIDFAATATDAEDGELPATAFTWWVDFHHDTHTHPQVLPMSGVKSGSFIVPVKGETADNVFFRIHLEVTDSGGLTRSLTRDVKPRKAKVTLASVPSGLQLWLDGQPVTTPYIFTGVVGIQRRIEAPTPQTIGGAGVVYRAWSDGGGRAHTIATPATTRTYTAEFSSTAKISIADASTVEGDTGTHNVVFAVILSSASPVPVSVAWSTADGSATAAQDYVASSGTVSFAPSVTTRTLVVPVLGDALVEPDETFRVNLSTAVGAVLDDTQATATVTNDDTLGTLRFSAASYRRNETGGPLTLTVLRKDSTSGAITVSYATSGGTATLGPDFQGSSGTLTFADGAASATLSIPIIDDRAIEPDETLTVSLSGPSAGAALGSPATATVTIVNDDLPGSLSFSAASYGKSESGLTATVTVTRTGGLASGVAVGYRTENGTASAGVDYTARSGTLVFAGGVASMTFAVPLLDDTVHEANETVTLILENPTNGATLGARSSASLTITDNDPAGAFAFGAGSYSRAENGGNAIITIKRSGGNASNVSIRYATTGGTATAAVDYTPVSGTVTFAAKQTLAQIAVPLSDDAITEGDEMVELSLSNPTGGATLGTTTATTLTILDNDD